MPPILVYLLRLSISLGVVWLFYQLLLRRLTFYGLNRGYLLGYSVLSFFIPLINIYPILRDEGPAGEPSLIQYIPVIGDPGRIVAGEGRVAVGKGYTTISWETWILWIFALGALVLLIRLAIRGLSLYRLRKSAPLIAGTSLKIYQVDASIIPFSFGHSIYINQHLHTEKQWSDIILHEYVHIRQRHTVDILLTELICMVNWYNPFSWLMRWSIRQNLEFIADQQVLGSGVDRKGYQYHLLTVLGEPRYRLANNFNFSSLKKRIIMMNKMRSARLHLVKFLFVVPLAAVLLVAFRDKYTGLWRPAAGQVYVNVAGIVLDISSKDPVAGAMVQDSISGLQATTDDRGFYQLHIPFTHDPIRLGLKFQKADYDSETSGEYIPMVKNTIGVIENMFLSHPGDHYKGLFGMFPPQGHIPEDPGYKDASAALHEVVQWNDNYALYLKAQKEHGITLLYASEDRPHDIIFLQDGTMEKYGYPGTPPLEAMAKKYGFPADIFGGSKQQVSEGYIARWGAISAETEKRFHTDNPDVRAVVFPGDSRVIVVPVTGKPRIFDMDNAAEVERTALEKLYGRLPDCVPPPANNTDAQEKAAGWPGRSAVSPGRADTAKPNVVMTRYPVIDSRKPLIVIDGVVMPGMKINELNPDSIYAIHILAGPDALTYYGDRGSNGVAAITTKAFHARHADDTTKPVALKNIKGNPLYVIDGLPVAAKEDFDKLSPDSIESISLIKDSSALAVYGSRAKDGVILVITKRGSAHSTSFTVPVIDEGKPRNAATIFPDSLLGRRVPLYVVDGHIWPCDSLNFLESDRIKSISVYKSDENTKQYGEKGKNGVIEITLKPKGMGAVKNEPPSGAVSMVDEKPLSVMSVIVNNGHQSVKFTGEGVTVVADTIKMKNVVISGYHPRP